MYVYIKSYTDHDYHTGTASGTDVIDVTTTGTSYYNNFLRETDAEYMKQAKNRKGTIVKMTPAEYYAACADLFGVTSDELKAQRKQDADRIEYLKSVITDKKKKFPLPYINTSEGQEGLHRMMALGELFGFNDVEFPVLLVEVADEHRELIHEIRSEFYKAVEKAVEYQFNEDDVESQLAQEVDYQLEQRNEDTLLKCAYSTREVEPHFGDVYFEIWADGYKEETCKTIWLASLRLAAPEDDEENDIDDIDDIDSLLDDIDSLLDDEEFDIDTLLFR